MSFLISLPLHPFFLPLARFRGTPFLSFSLAVLFLFKSHFAMYVFDALISSSMLLHSDDYLVQAEPYVCTPYEVSDM